MTGAARSLVALMPRWQPGPRGLRRSADDQIALLATAAMGVVAVLFIAWPLVSILGQAFQPAAGGGAGARWQALWSDARLQRAALSSIGLALLTLAVVLPLALAYAFALTRSRLWGRPVWRLLALLPLLAPSLMPAISLVYLFGNQGLLKGWLGGASIYGPLGIVMGEAFYTFPHAVLILATSLALADARLYEAAESLGASTWRRLLTITLPQARYGLVAAGLVVFTLVVTDFGVPKVIGGQTPVLALEAYKQVIGQQNFSQGAVIGLLLLTPALLSFGAERWLARRQSAGLSGRSVRYQPPVNRWRDGLLGLLCAVVAVALLAGVGVAVAASFIKLWPYQMQFTLAHYDFDQMDGGGWQAFINSLKLAGGTALIGTPLLFFSAYLLAKTRAPAGLAALLRGLLMLPMAVPGLVLGLGYIFCFNPPGHPLHGMYGSLGLMVAATVVHFATTAHLTLSTALGQIDPEIEAVGRSLRRAWWTSCWRVTLPICVPALLDVARYLFVSAMTTVSCVIFLYTPDTMLASVAVLNMDDAGDTAPAAAMASLIVLSAGVVTVLMTGLAMALSRRSQAWRQGD